MKIKFLIKYFYLKETDEILGWRLFPIMKGKVFIYFDNTTCMNLYLEIIYNK